MEPILTISAADMTCELSGVIGRVYLSLVVVGHLAETAVRVFESSEVGMMSFSVNEAGRANEIYYKTTRVDLV